MKPEAGGFWPKRIVMLSVTCYSGRERGGAGMKKYLLLMVLNCVLLFEIMHAFYEEPVKYELNYRFVLIYPQEWRDQHYEVPDMFEAKKANVKCVSFGNTKENEQVEAIQKAILANADGIITVGTGDSRELTEMVNEAEKQGIPVVLVDSDLYGTNRSGYAGTDNREAGALAGRDMAAATGGKAKIGIIVSDLERASQLERVEGFRSVLEEYPDMEVIRILECEADRTKIRRLIAEVLAEHPELDAIYCTENVSSEMAGEILGELRYEPGQIKVVCSELSAQIWDYIQEGRYYSAVVQNLYEQVNRAVVCLKAYKNGGDGTAETDTSWSGLASVKKDFDYESWSMSGRTEAAAWEAE